MLLMISKYLQQPDLVSLSLVDKACYSMAQHRLYMKGIFQPDVLQMPLDCRGRGRWTPTPCFFGEREATKISYPSSCSCIANVSLLIDMAVGKGFICVRTFITLMKNSHRSEISGVHTL